MSVRFRERFMCTCTAHSEKVLQKFSDTQCYYRSHFQRHQGTQFLKRPAELFESLLSLLHHWTHSGPLSGWLSPATTCSAPASKFSVGSTVSLITDHFSGIAAKKAWLEEHHYAKVGNWSCTEGNWTADLRRSERNGGKFICADSKLHVNGNNSGMFIFISHGNNYPFRY